MTSVWYLKLETTKTAEIKHLDFYNHKSVKCSESSITLHNTKLHDVVQQNIAFSMSLTIDIQEIPSGYAFSSAVSHVLMYTRPKRSQSIWSSTETMFAHPEALSSQDDQNRKKISQVEILGVNFSCRGLWTLRSVAENQPKSLEMAKRSMVCCFQAHN